MLVPAVPTIVGTTVLCVAPIRTYVLKKIVRHAGNAAGLDISVEDISLSFPLNINAYNISIAADGADSLLNVGEMGLRLRPAPLFRKIIDVESFDLENISINTNRYIENVYIRGSLEHLSTDAVINLKTEEASISHIDLRSLLAGIRLSIQPDSADTASAPLSWKINIGEISLASINADISMPEDSLEMYSHNRRLLASGITADLAASSYNINRIRLAGSDNGYRHVNAPETEGFNPQHIALHNMNVSIDSVVYNDRTVGLIINAIDAEEDSGLRLSSLSGIIRSDGAMLDIPEFQAATPHSSVSLQAKIPLSILEENNTMEADGSLVLSIGKSDILTFIPDLFGYKSQYPDQPLVLDARMRGNMSRAGIERLNIRQHTTFAFRSTGTLLYPADSIRRSAGIDFSADLDNPLLGLNGKITFSENTVSAGVDLSRSAKAGLNAFYSLNDASYRLELTVDSLEPSSLLRMDTASFVSATLKAEGRGFDIFADSTWTDISARLIDFRYGKINARNARIAASLHNHDLRISLISSNPAAAMDFDFDGRIARNSLSGMLSGNVDSLSLNALGIIDTPFSTSFNLFAEMESDMKFLHNVDITLGNWEMNVFNSPFRAKTLTLHAEAGADTTRLSFHAGDLGAVLTGGAGLDKASAHVANVMETVTRQLREDSMINLSAIRPLLPNISLAMSAGKDNPVSDVLKKYNVEFNRFFVDASISPDEGIFADAGLYTLYRDTTRIDTIRAIVRPMNNGLTYKAEVIKNRYLRQSPFTAEAKGSLVNRQVDAELTYRNNLNQTGLHLGVKGVKQRDGIDLSFFPDTAILAFNPFALNDENYVKFRSNKDIDADVKFTGDNHSMLWIHTDRHQDVPFPVVHTEFSQIPLGVISQGFVDLPSLRGLVSGGFQYAPSEESFEVMGDVHIDDLVYEGGHVGELMLNATYIPLADDVHQVDMHFYRNMDEISSATATYDTGKDSISGSLQVDALPLSMLSPFVPQTSFKGALNGHIDISGTAAAPVVNGYMQADTADIFSSAVSSHFRPDSKKIEIVDNRLRLDRYNIFASGDNPFVIDGIIDFSNTSKVTADLRAGGSRLQLLDARRTPESIAYGKLLADMSTTVKGQLSSLTVRGDIRLLGGTNLTYIMQESPLTVEDHLKDLVTFTSFADTSRMRRRGRGDMPQLPVSGMDMLLLVHIDPVVRFGADISPDQSSYVTLEGGGDLSIQYNRNGQMLLNGRYTLSDGKLKYALPVIPLKEFSVRKDSYIQWDGDVFNPLLGLAATQRMRTNVSLAGESPRLVDFEVGVDVRDRLESMSLMFTIDAPDDAGVQAELDKMGAEGRSTQAVGMMVTGLYLAGGGAGKNSVNMSDALNSVLRSGISSIAGSAMKSFDISFGVDTYELTPETGGGQRTDYSFRFAKRFLEDRLRVAVGGKVSSGNVQQKEAFIDNASIEYRINKSGTGHIKLFHNKKFQGILDGEITETGAGLVFRRKMLNLSELFK